MGNRQVIVLTLDGKEFGLCMDNVSVIERPLDVCRIPGAPSYIEGLADLRGKVHTIVNLRKRLGLPERAADEETRVVILEACSSLIGITVDSVREIISIDDESIDENQAISGDKFIEQVKRFIKGIARTSKKAIPLLEPDALVTRD